jgi:hypothetical protein
LYNGDELKLVPAKETDRAAWASATASLLEDHDFESLDIAALAEEMRLLSAADFHELQSRLRVLIMHLLKWAYQPEKRSRSWLSTILTQRFEITTLVKQSPSLWTRLQAEDLEQIWEQAANLAATETGIDLEKFPGECIWELKAEILLSDWLPGKMS